MPIKNEATIQENKKKELEKKYEETEQKLIDVLSENQERIKLLSQINIMENNIKEHSNSKQTDNGFFVTNNININNEQNNNNLKEIDENQAENKKNNLDNNEVNNSKINASHTSKLRLLNLNTEKSQNNNKNEENQNDLSVNALKIKIDNNEDENEDFKENYDILDKLNDSRFSKKSKVCQIEKKIENYFHFKNGEEEEFNQEGQMDVENLMDNKTQENQAEKEKIELESNNEQAREVSMDQDFKGEVLNAEEVISDKGNFDLEKQEQNKHDTEKNQVEEEDMDKLKIQSDLGEEVNNHEAIEDNIDNDNNNLNNNLQEKLDSSKLKEQENKGINKYHLKNFM